MLRSERCVAAAGGKGPAAAGGLLLAAHRGGYEIFERVAGGFVPFLRERAAARPAGERGGCVGDGFLRVAHQHGRSCVGEIGIRFQVAQANLGVLGGAEEIHAVSPPFPYAKGQALAARRQAAVLREVHHLDEILRRAIRALPDFHRHEQIGGKLIGRRSRIGDCDLQRCIDLRDRRDDQEHVVLDESADAGIAERACVLRYAEFAYGSSTASVNRFPCESFSSERTSEVICPAVLYADEPTTGMLPSLSYLP